MGRKYHRCALLSSGNEHVAHHLDGDGIQAGKRLVKHQDIGIVHQRRRQLHPLLVPEAQVCELAGGSFRQAQLFQKPLGVRGGFLGAKPVQPGQKHQLVQDFLLRIQASLLWHVADVAPIIGGDGCAIPQHLAGVGGKHPQDDAHRCGLARAIGSNEPVDFAGFYGKRHVGERGNVTKIFA